MLIGYVRVLKLDGYQMIDLQRGGLIDSDSVLTPICISVIRLLAYPGILLLYSSISLLSSQISSLSVGK